MSQQDPTETVLALAPPTTPSEVHPYASFIHKVQKPARYLGGELYQVKKPHTDVDVTICLAFPDLYDLGMSHLGTKILPVLNDNQCIMRTRLCPLGRHGNRAAKARKLPVYSLESATALADFDVLGFSLQYEMTHQRSNSLTSQVAAPRRRPR